MRLAAFFLLGLLLLLAAGKVFRAPQAYAIQDREQIAAAPGTTHLAGTDELGRDRAARV